MLTSPLLAPITAASTLLFLLPTTSSATALHPIVPGPDAVPLSHDARDISAPAVHADALGSDARNLTALSGNKPMHQWPKRGCPATKKREVTPLERDAMRFAERNGKRFDPSVSRKKKSTSGEEKSASGVEKRDTSKNGTNFIWTIQDTYAGSNFFDGWNFYTGEDPTHGTVNYVDAGTAWNAGLVNVTSDGKVVIKGDDSTWLPNGGSRNSVRISSKAVYESGLFILDLNKAPWGCGVWPAFWTLGTGSWPDAGEIDIIEGVHDNEHNQVAFHTQDGCMLTPKPTEEFSGTVVQKDNEDNLVCYGCVNQNSGCAVVEWSRASYGPYFDSQGGGVYAMLWDEDGISVYSFYRAAVPDDINDGSPTPEQWGTPVARLSGDGCDISKYFSNHTIIINITFCGDWAGNSYATTTCPGTCAERLMDPSNFVNATWNINSLKVYKKQNIRPPVGAASSLLMSSTGSRWTMVGMGFVWAMGMWFGM